MHLEPNKQYKSDRSCHRDVLWFIWLSFGILTFELDTSSELCVNDANSQMWHFESAVWASSRDSSLPLGILHFIAKSIYDGLYEQYLKRSTNIEEMPTRQIIDLARLFSTLFNLEVRKWFELFWEAQQTSTGKTTEIRPRCYILYSGDTCPWPAFYCDISIHQWTVRIP